MQDWSSNKMINILLDENCKVKEVDQFVSNKRLLKFEFEEMKRTLIDYVESASGAGPGLEGGWLSKIRRTVHLYNIYGRIITKKIRGIPTIMNF